MQAKAIIKKKNTRWILLHSATFLSIDCGQSIRKPRGYVYKIDRSKEQKQKKNQLNGWIKNVAAEEILFSHTAVFTYGECDKL
jgi:hypothetical protein